MQTDKHRIGTNHQDKTSIRHARVFISYSRKDGEEFAKDLRTFLEKRNIPLWQDRVGMEGGRDWWLQIVEALDKVEFMVIVMTPKAIASPIVRKEWRYARQKGVCVYPVKGVLDAELDYNSLPRWIRSAHFYDLNYEREKFINDLNTRCREPRIPFMVDDLPKNFVQRPKEFNALIDQLFDVEREEPLAITTSLRGAGGFGKTTLAMALCHDERVQEAYDDGILWVTLGKEPGDLTEKIKNLIEILSGDRPGFTDEETASTYLSELLADRDLLIVIDDAWDREHIQPFLRGGPHCSRLITTRNSDTLPSEAKRNILDTMQDDEALSLLGFKLPPSEKDELKKLSQRLGHWPLVHTMVNTFLIERVLNRGQPLSSAISYVNKKLEKYGIIAFDARNTESRNQAVEGTLSVSLELLNSEEKDRFHELAIFSEDTDIPLETVEKLWMHAGFDDLDTEDLCERLFQFSLLLNFDPRTRMIRLHDVIRSYLRKKNEHHLSLLHAKFLDSYGVDQWADLPITEPYLWKNLAYHLIDGGESNRLKNLLFDYDWLKGKLAVSDVNAVIADYDYLPDENELALVQQALRLSANQLAHDRHHLAPHLIGRLKDRKSHNIQNLLSKAIGSQDGLWLMPICRSMTPPSGLLLQTFEGHSKAVNELVISLDGKTVVSSSSDDTLKVWDLDTGKVIHTLEGHPHWGRALAISPDGKNVVFGSDDNILKRWDLGTDNVINAFQEDNSSFIALAISPDCKTALFGSGDNTLKLWDLCTGKVIHTLEGHSNIATNAAISSDGKTAVSSSIDNTLKLWDLVLGKVIHTLEGVGYDFSALAISSDGKMVVFGSEDNTLRLWDLGTHNVIHALRGQRSDYTAVAISPDGKTAVSGSYDKTLKMWDLGTRKVLQIFEGHSNIVNTLVISPNGKTVVSGSDDNTLKIWDIGTHKFSDTLKSHSSIITFVSINPDSKTALSGSVNTLKLWDLGTGKVLQTFEGPNSIVYAAAISPDGKIFVFGSDDRTLKLWDLGTGKVIQTFEREYDLVNAVAISPDGKTAFSSSLGNNSILWDLGTGKVLKTFARHSDKSNAVTFSPDGRIVVFGSDDRTLKLWDLGTGKVIQTFEGHCEQVNAVAISPDGKTILSSSLDKTLNLWDLGTGQNIASFIGDSIMLSVAISHFGRTILAGEVSGYLHFLRLKGV